MVDEVDVGAVSQFPVREILTLEVGEKSCVLVRTVGDQISIFEDLCPHLGLPLNGGRLDGDNLICRWHGAHFDLKTGKSLSPMSEDPLKQIKTRIEAGRILCEKES